jgi:crotonobetainyl-CoA:carnitine CoA-transferase CaiB-like acyl-CoA transferase
LSFAGSAVRLAANVADMAAGLYASISVVTCLRHRTQTGLGQYIDLSITDSSYGLMTAQLAGQEELPSPPGAFGVFTCSDGRQVTLGAVEEHFWRALCATVDRPDWLDDSRFADSASRRTYGADLRVEVAAALKGRTSDQWLAVFKQAEIPASPVNNYVEAVGDPYAVDRKVVSWVHQPGVGEIPQVRFPGQFSESRLRPGSRAPEVGEHTDLLLKELGYSQGDIEALHTSGAVSADLVR